MSRVLLSILLISLVGGLGIQVEAQQVKPALESLAWISGCWELAKNGQNISERWGKPTENLMLGTSQTIKGSKSVAFEYLRIINDGQGLAYIAKPSTAKEETRFAVSKVGDKEVIFENLKHDFPQRIIYKQSKPEALAARVEGLINGQMKGMDFPMKRVPCE